MDIILGLLRRMITSNYVSVIKGVFHELGLPLVGTAYTDKDTLSMYEAYQDSRSIYYIVEKEGLYFGWLWN